jgi:hypothetical protein
MPNNIQALEDLPEEILPKDHYDLWLSVENGWQSDIYTSEEKQSQCFLKLAIIHTRTQNFI